MACLSTPPVWEVTSTSTLPWCASWRSRGTLWPGCA
uniref:Uncharacterized protein n=1 Tax=Timema douglasi TaxID=61478 RepID=A0A7R8ZF69_TIMDO|nr:unnamed protein product [Timema douglasi]